MIKRFSKQTLGILLVAVISMMMTACSNDDEVFGTCFVLVTTEATPKLLITAEAVGFEPYDEVLTDIPFQGSTPDVTLGTAKIQVDLVLKEIQ